jgi:hypothetical protein
MIGLQAGFLFINMKRVDNIESFQNSNPASTLQAPNSMQLINNRLMRKRNISVM